VEEKVVAQLLDRVMLLLAEVEAEALLLRLEKKGHRLVAKVEALALLLEKMQMLKVVVAAVLLLLKNLKQKSFPSLQVPHL